MKTDGRVIQSMLPGLTREQMTEVDRIMMEDLQIPVDLMMENAGYSLARLLVRYYPDRNRAIQVIAGSGNNGGGGLVAARRLKSWNRPVEVFLPRGVESLRDVPRKQLNRLREMSVTIHEDLPPVDSKDTVTLDAYLGYNFERRLDVTTDRVLEFLSHRKDVISLDIPSGLDANTGEGIEEFHPAMTLTIAFPKVGLFLAHRKQTGGIFLCDIGVPVNVYENSIGIEWVAPYRFNELKEIELSFERSPIYQLKRESHKKTGQVGWRAVT